MKNNKQISLAEFRAWLEGVEELQPARWSPNSNQWKLIRQKIDCIQAPAPITVQQTTPPQYMHNQRQPTEQALTEVDGQASALPDLAVPGIPINLSSVFKHHQQPIGGIKTQGGTIVTPNIDTSSGGFKSSFV
ncbi:MAG: hypothetical protein ACREAU_03130 [Nitrosopumilaceae archaeon]